LESKLEWKENYGCKNENEFYVLLGLRNVSFTDGSTNQAASCKWESLGNLVTYAHDITENNLGSSSVNFEVAWLKCNNLVAP
jgi:hypothetical protein